MWVSVADAARKFGVKSSQIHSVRLQGTIPDWMEKRQNKWLVDDESRDLFFFLKSKSRKARAGKQGSLKRKRKKKLKESKELSLSMEETERLQEISIQAELSKPITNLRLETYKIESQKLELEKKAGNLISRSLADYLYIGYLDRMNRELLQFKNRLVVDLEKQVNNILFRIKEGEEINPAEEADIMRDLFSEGTEEVIKSIKKDQAKELKKWARDEGISL